MSNINANRYLSTGYLKSKTGKVDREKGIIYDVSVCTVGEAKGHGVNLDSEFIDTVVKFGAEEKGGLKARFGHPNMCSTALGTFLGRYKNFHKDGDQAKADLFLSNTAKKTPKGNLYEYVLDMAEKNPDMFGTSIVFTPGREYRRDSEGNKWFRSWDEFEVWYENEDGERCEDEEDLSEELYTECKELHACDAVDEPAANDGLFSKFSNETLAGQITEFLDLHPQVWEALNSNHEILKALSSHAPRLDEFIGKYQEYKSRKGERSMSEENTNPVEGSDEPKTSAPEAPKETPAPAEPEAAGKSAEPQGETEPERTQQSAKTIDAVEFASLVETFGAEIAAKVALSGGGMQEAYKLQAEALKKENELLKKELGEHEEAKGGSPTKLSSEKKTKTKVFKKDREE